MDLGNNPGAGDSEGGNPGSPEMADPNAAAAGDFLSSLNDEQRGIAQANGWNGVGSVFEGYQSLNTQLASSIALPGQEATDEQRAEFYGKVAETWTPKDGYSFAMPEGLPEDFPYDQDFAKEANGWFQDAGLHPNAAQALHDKWVGKMAEAHGQSVAHANERAQAQAEAVDNAHRELVKEYGEPGTDGYSNVVAKADRAMSNLTAQGIDVNGWFAEKGILSEADENGLQQVADPVAVKLLSFIHDRAFSEDGLDPGAGGAGANPFDLKSPDLEKQNELIRSNPDRARQMVVAAGRDPKSFYL
ncbi:hypothetical protein [uncultured Roseibium sp.]|uniref:hypothetical protein n=1 Tax=uncultured Roseibium sp. TaxID=1936171 RepID=UPI002595B340|nr:hypothetical protein [uncultured Roseibium sp.]